MRRVSYKIPWWRRGKRDVTRQAADQSKSEEPEQNMSICSTDFSASSFIQQFKSNKRSFTTARGEEGGVGQNEGGVQTDSNQSMIRWNT